MYPFDGTSKKVVCISNKVSKPSVAGCFGFHSIITTKRTGNNGRVVTKLRGICDISPITIFSGYDMVSPFPNSRT